MEHDIEGILIPADDISRRLDELAQQIVNEMAGPDGAELTIVPILTGSIIFLADLIRRMPLPLQIHVMSVTSYPGKATTSRGAAIRDHLDEFPASLAGRHVLILDDILDSGQTLELVHREMQAREPASLKSCVLLRKDRGEPPCFEADYTAFSIPNAFVVGYGLDYDGYYRNLPDIVTLKPQRFADADE